MLTSDNFSRRVSFLRIKLSCNLMNSSRFIHYNGGQRAGVADIERIKKLARNRAYTDGECCFGLF